MDLAVIVGRRERSQATKDRPQENSSGGGGEGWIPCVRPKNTKDVRNQQWAMCEGSFIALFRSKKSGGSKKSGESSDYMFL